MFNEVAAADKSSAENGWPSVMLDLFIISPDDAFFMMTAASAMRLIGLMLRGAGDRKDFCMPRMSGR